MGGGFLPRNHKILIVNSEIGWFDELRFNQKTKQEVKESWGGSSDKTLMILHRFSPRMNKLKTMIQRVASLQFLIDCGLMESDMKKLPGDISC
jgi:hypothetical protein